MGAGELKKENKKRLVTDGRVDEHVFGRDLMRAR